MGLKEFFMPSVAKASFAVLLVIAAMIPSSISQFPNMQFDVISQLQLILLLPWFTLNLPALGILGGIIWVVYVYVIASIYAYAYSLIESMLRDEFPGLNRRWANKAGRVQKSAVKKAAKARPRPNKRRR
jgi:hypothetical protein